MEETKMPLEYFAEQIRTILRRAIILSVVIFMATTAAFSAMLTGPQSPSPQTTIVAQLARGV